MNLFNSLSPITKRRPSSNRFNLSLFKNCVIDFEERQSNFDEVILSETSSRLKEKKNLDFFEDKQEYNRSFELASVKLSPKDENNFSTTINSEEESFLSCLKVNHPKKHLKIKKKKVTNIQTKRRNFQNQEVFQNKNQKNDINESASKKIFHKFIQRIKKSKLGSKEVPSNIIKLINSSKKKPKEHNYFFHTLSNLDNAFILSDLESDDSVLSRN
jgi:hypothetical protein